MSGTSDSVTMANVKPFSNRRVFDRVSMPEIPTTTTTSATAPMIAVRHSGTRFSSRNFVVPTRKRLCGRASNAMNSTMVGRADRTPDNEKPKAVWGNHDSSDTIR